VAEDILRVAVPEHRLDCRYPADLIEEVARIHGYDLIPVTEMADQLPPQRANRELDLEDDVRDVLAACGLQEVVTYSLTNLEREAAVDPAKTADDLPIESYVALANPISQERSVMRHSLLVTGLETAAANLRFRDRVEIFEVGKVFLLKPGNELPEEPLRLAIVMTGPRNDRHWLVSEGPDIDFFDLKGIVEALLVRLHLSEAMYEPVEHAMFQPGRVARLLLKSSLRGSQQSMETVEVGILGEIHPAVREAFDLPGRRVAAAELDLEALLALVPPSWFVEPISSYPAVLQDLSVVVDESVPAAVVQDLIAKAGGFLLKEVRLFDVYRGDPVPAGQKSLAYALTFQAPDKTLRDAIVAKQVKRIVKRLNAELGAQLRS
jgi:phenylalanyl-tRNA synthetase beta chain